MKVIKVTKEYFQTEDEIEVGLNLAELEKYEV